MRRILLVNPFGIGDALFTLTLAESIRAALPDSYIGFVCNERTVDIVRHCRAVDRTIVFNRDHLRAAWKKSIFLGLRELRALVRLVRDEKFDTFLDLSLGREYAFFAMRAGIRERIGLNYRNRGLFLTQKINVRSYDDAPVADTQLRLLAKAGIHAVPGRALSTIRVPALAAPPRQRYIVVAPGGGKSWGPNAPYKQWAPERFAEAAERCCREMGFEAVVMGEDEERGLLEEVASRLRVKHVLCCGRPLDEAASLLSKAELLLCNDGGLMHLAHALGVKVVALFGPVDPSVYGPYGAGAAVRILTADVPCRPCYHDFRFPPCAHQKRCLTEIGADRAVAAMKEIV